MSCQLSDADVGDSIISGLPSYVAGSEDEDDCECHGDETCRAESEGHGGNSGQPSDEQAGQYYESLAVSLKARRSAS